MMKLKTAQTKEIHKIKYFSKYNNDNNKRFFKKMTASDC